MTSIGDLEPDKRNARRHTPRNVGMIESSIQRDGFGRSVLLAADDTIIAGNATIDAAASAGLENVRIIDSDGTEVIAIRRTDVAAGSPEFHNLALADNRASDLAEWNAEVLTSFADEIDLDQFFRDDELARILGQLQEFDPNAEWQGMPEFANEDVMPFKRLTVNFHTQADYEQFAQLIGQNLTDSTKWVWYPPKHEQRMIYTNDE